VIARRYQLRKEAVGVVMSNHPWIFRDQLSSAAAVFGDGDWLKLVGGNNEILGYGIYEATGAIAIRILKRGSDRPDAAWLRGRIAAALDKRKDLVIRTDGIRLVNGESDGIPAVVADRYGASIVVTSYATGADGLARYVACALGGDIAGPARHVVLRPARRRHTDPPAPRVIRGEPGFAASFGEDGVAYAVDLDHQKTGAYLDLRGLRRAIATSPLTGAHVLNLFAYTGMLSKAAELAGAAEIVSVDQSDRALGFAQAHHVVDPARHRFIAADVFAWLPAHTGVYDLVIVDPPAMTSKKVQVPSVLAGYTKLYRAAARTVRPGGTLVAACCTSRITRDAFRSCVATALGPSFEHVHEISPEVDHPVNFPQADYLKISLWKRVQP
jgi:23S rRNA (cytosine1962-C5)-methyltransferase